MAKLKLGAVPDDRPVKVTLELPAQLQRDLALYAEILAQQTGQPVDPAKLIPHMLARFIASDREFGRLRRSDRLQTGKITGLKGDRPKD